MQYRAVVKFSNLGVLNADSNRLSISVLFSETPNSRGAKAFPAPPLTTTLNILSICCVYYVLSGSK